MFTFQKLSTQATTSSKRQNFKNKVSSIKLIHICDGWFYLICNLFRMHILIIDGQWWLWLLIDVIFWLDHWWEMTSVEKSINENSKLRSNDNPSLMSSLDIRKHSTWVSHHNSGKSHSTKEWIPSTSTIIKVNALSSMQTKDTTFKSQLLYPNTIINQLLLLMAILINKSSINFPFQLSHHNSNYNKSIV